MSSASAAEGDYVDRARANWVRVYPDLDVSSIEIMGRITRIAAKASARVDQDLSPAGITRAEFDVLCTLARSDRPLRASEVTVATMLSGASTTKNADRLARLGLVERLPWERDGRVVLLGLTAAGRAMVDQQFPQFCDRDQELLEGLDPAEREQLAALLRRITGNLEPGA